MLDDYGLRLLAEIGVEVYLPRQAPRTPYAAKEERPTGRVAFVCADDAHAGLRGQVVKALRACGLRVVEAGQADLAQVEGLAGVVVLGQAQARALGASLPAQRHAAIEWIIADDAATLASGAASKRALWGEIKRLVRALAARG